MVIIVQITSEIKTESMRVTACRATGYAASYGDSSEHQICREELQVFLIQTVVRVQARVSYKQQNITYKNMKKIMPLCQIEMYTHVF